MVARAGFLLDTNVVSELMKRRPNRGVATWIDATDEALLYLSVITLGEVRKGIDLLENFLQAHCAQGNLAIMASHHVSRALRLCTRAVILHQGRLSFDEVKQQPWPSFARAFSDFLPQGESWNS